MRRLAGVLAVLAGVLVGAATVRAEAAPELVKTLSAGVVTDGESLAAWQEASARLLLLPDAVPADRPQPVELEQRCGVGAIGRRAAGALCSTLDGQPVPAVFDLFTRKQKQLRGGAAALAALGTEGIVGVPAIGDRWLQLARGERTVLLHRERGRLLRDPRLSPREVVDLDARSAKRRLCAPLRVPTRGRLRAPAISRPPFLLLRAPDGALRLHRCGEPHARTLSRDPDAPFTLSARFAAWALGATVRVRELSSGQTHSWRTPRGERVAALRTTDRRLYVETTTAVSSATAGPTYVVELSG